MTTLLLVDDHPLFLDGVRAALAGEDDIEVVGEAHDVATAVALAGVVVPASLWIGACAFVTGAYRPETALLLNGVLGDDRWSPDWHFWFLEALVWAYLGVAALLAVPATAAAPAPPAATAPADATFAAMKALVGTWRNADNPASPLRIHFYLTAGGTVLVEEWRRGTQPHSLTLYHRDGATLIATHYCPQGNQPRLTLAGRGPKLAFTFRDVTNLAPGESHLHDLAFDLTDPARPVRSEVYRSPAGKDEPSRLVLARISEAPPAIGGAE